MTVASIDATRASAMPSNSLPNASRLADPRLGVVVLTHNRASELCRTLERLTALPEQPEIVVVDNASADATAELLRLRFPAVRHVRLQQNVGAAARNLGVRLCARPYVALCDDDTWWEAGSLARAAAILDSHPRVALITGRVLVGDAQRVDPTCLEMARSPLPAAAGAPGAPLLGFLAGASVVRRDAFLAAGGFEPRFFLGGEEQLLAIDLASAGWSLIYRGDLTVHHHPSPHRDASGRRRLLTRNMLWTLWLRRPLRLALAGTLAAVCSARHDAEARAALLDALRGAPWVLRRRSAASAAVERGLQLLDSRRGMPNL
jgi:GT2 family glycosyltransferase